MTVGEHEIDPGRDDPQPEDVARFGGDDDEPGDPGAEEALAAARAEADAWREKYMRALADAQNAQRRAVQNERAARDEGVTAVVRAMLTVVDHFDLALAQDVSRASAEQIVRGVTMIRDEMVRVLKASGVGEVSPGVGDAIDPVRHEVVTHEDVEGVAPGHVARVLQTGYTLGDRVIRPAKVAVAPDAPREAC